ncbi:hypothetical protein [[Eubacterium] cellulosolvens]
MATGLLANPRMRQLFVIGIIVALILVMFVVMLVFGVTEEDEIINLEQQEFIDVPVTEEIPMADSDVIEIDGFLYPHPDKLFDIEEIWIYGTNETDPDSDDDGMEDGWEAFHAKIDLLTGLPTLDPMRFDAFENPDGDGWDSDHNAAIQGNEHLTNLEEYCGGSYNWGPFAGHNLDPQGHYENWKKLEKTNKDEATKEKNRYINDTIYIQTHGGFHLVDYPYSQVLLEDFADYAKAPTLEYKSYDPQKDRPLTPDPSNSDSDFDGMNDGFEIFFREKCELIARSFYPGYNYTFDPLDAKDSNLNFDLRRSDSSIRGEVDLEYEYRPDNLTNVQEFEAGTDPTMWDSDDDSYYDPISNRITFLPDHYELLPRYFIEIGDQKIVTSSVDWDYDGIINLNTNPNSPDTDGDFMGDGWEENYALNPCNASDRFLDNDDDGLPNYLEFAYPNATNVWFRTMPNDRDTDNDGMPDGWEAFNTKIINRIYPAGPLIDLQDGLPDGIAHTFSVNPMIYDADLDLDGIWYDEPFDDLQEDVYHSKPDNLTNIQEYLNSINPNLPDSDGDGLTDGEEVGYWYCLSSKKTITWWICDNENCKLYGEDIPQRTCPVCGDESQMTEECDIEKIMLRGGFYGKLMSGRWITDPLVADIYFTNASSANSDGDFGTGAEINESRFLDDWEEIHGMEHELADYIDNDGDGEYGSPTTWIDYNLNGFPDENELSAFSTVPQFPGDERFEGGVIGAVADGKDNDGDGTIDEGIDEEGEGITFPMVNASYYDTDHDGLGDVDEIFGVDTGSEYDPNNPLSGYGTVFPHPGYEDTDEDFLNDYVEITTLATYKDYITNPLDQDSDKDGLTDGKEWEVDFFPLEDHDIKNNIDANGDGSIDSNDNGVLVNGIKVDNRIDRTNPRSKDSDYDDLPDGWEYDYGKTKLRKFIRWHDIKFKSNWVTRINTQYGGFTNGEAPMEVWVINPVDQNDKYEDPDGDGLVNWDEYELGTDPLNWDSDKDGLPDGWEIKYRKWVWEGGYNGFNLNPSTADSNLNDIEDDEDNDGNTDPAEELWDGKDNDGDGEVVIGAKDLKDNDGDGLVDEPDEISYINWIDDDGDGIVDEGIDEEWDLNDANEDYDWDGTWYFIAWFDDDLDEEYDEDPIDDDFDYMINEDPADGIDNDGDGLIDEDTGGEEDDNDGDGYIDEDPKKYYHPFTNLMEYKYGIDEDGDGINDKTTKPNTADTDGDLANDGDELWFTDEITNTSNIRPYQDNDTLPRGWEDLFNGSLVIFLTDYTPQGLLNDPGKYIGKFNPNDKDSNDNGIPDGEENYDDDEWIDPHPERNPEHTSAACNNSAEYTGHSDPTDGFSTPKTEYRAIASPETIEQSDTDACTLVDPDSSEPEFNTAPDGNTFSEDWVKAEIAVDYASGRAEFNKAIISNQREEY